MRYEECDAKMKEVGDLEETLPLPRTSEQTLGSGCLAYSLVGWFGSGSVVQLFHLPMLAARLGDPEWVGQDLAVQLGLVMAWAT